MLFRKSKKADATTATTTSPEITNTPEPIVPTTADAKTNEEEIDVPGADLAPVATTATEDIVYPSGMKLALLLGSVFITMFLVALDRLIIATAIPQITDDFHSVTDIGWYGSAYLLTTCAFQLLYGKIYTFYSVKIVFLSVVFLFEVGSAICGAAPNSVAFIVGRAIAGMGAGGIFSGVIVILVYAVPLHKRPLYQGLFGAVFGVASVVGPLLGGAFTTNVTWRWCFYINLPLGGVAMVLIFLLLQIPDRETTKLPVKEKLSQLDGYGTALIVPGSVCLLLALQWGGLTYPWNEGRIVAMLVLAGVLIIGFVLVQVYLPKTATIPPRIFLQRSILAGFWSTLCTGSQMMIFVYFLPIWFQAIQGVSAVQSGIRTLPMVLSMVAASMISGVLIARIGYYTPVMICGVCFLSVGAGLLTTLDLETSQAKWIGYQFLYGWGMGCTFQAPNLAAQTVLSHRDVPIGTSLMFFAQLLGGAVFISVGQNVLNNQLLERLSGLAGFNPAFIQSSGATSLTHLPDGIKETVLVAYNESLRKVFQVGLVLTCLTIFGALAMEWRSVKENMVKKNKSVEDGKAGVTGEAKRVESDDEKTTDEADELKRAEAGETKTADESAPAMGQGVAAEQEREKEMEKETQA